jgi:amino acid adenylation domain-containing protein
MTKVDYNPFSAGSVALAVPTTEAQREIWATLALDKDATLCYNESLSMDLKGAIEPQLLNNAFQEILKRHDALRSIFSLDGKFFFIKEYKPQPVRFLDLSSSANKESDLEKLKQTQVSEKIDLFTGPCFFATLVKISTDHYVLIITGHHIICDGWSFAVILSELSTIYSALEKNVSFSFEPAAQFTDYAVSELNSNADISHKEYWLRQFKNPARTKKMPLDFPRPSYRTYNSARCEIEVPELTVKKVKKFGASQGCSFYTILMASFQVLISRLNGAEELVIGMASAAQAESGKSDLIGHLVNLLPLRTQIDRNQGFKFFLKELRTRMLDSFEHQNFSYGTLLKELNLERDPSEIPLLNIVFNIDQQAPGQGLRFDGLEASYTTIPRSFENFEMFVNAVSCENKLVFECQFNKNLFKETTIQNWFNSYIKLLDLIVENPENSIGQFEIAGLHIPQAVNSSIEVVQKKIVKNPQVEARLRLIWEKVLEVEGIKSTDNFFTLGGHSLLAVEVASLVQEEFKRDISIRDIFENPTLTELTSCLAEGPQTVREDVEISPSEVDRSLFPVSHNQMQVWYLEEMYPGTVMHNLPSSIRMKFAVDRVVLERTLQYLVQRHAALRTAIVIENGVPVQKVYAQNSPQLLFKLDLVQATEDTILKVLNNEANSNFKKDEPPLFDAKLYQLGENDFVFYFMVHHAVWDGWSFDIFFEELNIIYSALLKDAEPEFTRNPEVTYADYTLWLQQSIDQGRFDSQLNFWKAKLQGPLPALELPADFKRPITASHEGATFPFQLSPEQASNLRVYAQAQGTSLFNVLLTAFKVTLSRYCNLDDIIVGSPVRARNNSKLLQTIGYFVNTVALRSHVKLNDTFEGFLKQVTRNCLEAFDNQDLPFQVVLNNVDYARDSGRTAIFQTFFSYQDVNNREAIINGYPYTQINIDKASTHTDLDLWVKANDKKIEGAFEYRKDLFKEVTIKRLHDCFMNLLTNLSANTNVPLIRQAVLPTSQSQLVLKDWNNTHVSTNTLIPFHKMFELMAGKFPLHLAIESSNKSINYKDLDTLSNRVANGLISRGIKPGDLVGVSLSRDLNMMIALLGILKSGAGYVPLDPAFPQDRLDYMIESSVPKVLITEATLAPRFSRFGSTTLIDDLLGDPHASASNPQISSNLSDTMYVIYTSGSTGKPKGVQVSHGALSNFLVSMAKAPGLKTDDKLLAVTTLSFDIATLELYLPLSQGAALFLASSFDVIDGRALKNIIEKHNINVMQATPSTWRLLLAAGWTGESRFKVLCGGEAFPIDLAQKLISICGSVWNMYGPTETTVWSTCKKLSSSDLSVTIGRPIDNTLTYVLDEGLNLAPIGAPGELFIGGLGLAEGYFKRPDLTAERFIQNPFVPGQKMYATGDYARFTCDGEIECLGRQDGQVKVRGYRIELGEIEAVISKVSSVKENAVITKETRPGDVRIIAFLVLNNQKPLDEKTLRESLGELLPKYMIPSHFVVLENLPKTLNGKIDKKSLGTKFVETKELSSTSVTSPVSSTVPIESQIYEDLKLVWIEVLSLPNIAPNDNFFNIGGNSLLAVQLFSKIAAKYKISLPLSLLLEAADFQAFVEAVKLKLAGPQQSKSASALMPNAFLSLVSLKASGIKNPIFCFHGVGGNVLNYMSLVPAVGENRPLIGLQSRGMDGMHPMANSIEEMARSYIHEIKAVQPQGPYYLAGGSMGGMIALEVAQQLLKMGDKVEKLVMFDTFGPNVNIKVYDKSERSFWGNLKTSFFYRRKMLSSKLRSALFNLIGAQLPLEIRLFNVEMSNYRALWKYKAQVYDGDLHLIRGKLKPSGWYSDPQMGWSNTIAGKISTYEIEGTHGDFIESPQLVNVLSKLV